ncbi:hypothetical protein BDR03DRAFT_985620 [Suillus americanus]|nr:hypothetical protein BDR03DRAFT_985620 [Suillus americanus]
MPSIPVETLNYHAGHNDSYSCLIINDALDWMADVVNVILGVIMIARLHAMYQRSRKVLIFLVVIYLAIKIANIVITAITMMQTAGEEFVLSGTCLCNLDYGGDSVWGVLALCLAVWIAVKHFRELRQHSTRGIIGDCFTVLMKTHIGFISPTPLIVNLYSLDTQIYYGFAMIFQFVGLFVLGPRLILGVREYHAELVANFDTATDVTSIAFQEHVHVSTSSSV